MPTDFLTAAAILWIAGGVIALTGRALPGARWALVLGGLAAIVAAILALPNGTMPVELPMRMAGETVIYQIAPDGLWLLGFGLTPAVLACWLGTPAHQNSAGWLFGAAVSLLGALGVFGVQNGGGFLIAWEIMSLGGAIMILSDQLTPSSGYSALYMLGLLEVGAVALLIAVLLIAHPAQSLAFDKFPAAIAGLSSWLQIVIGILLIVGFGAKLGLLPFYEWFPGAYQAGSGASGAIMSGVVLNAAFYGLGRGLIEWLRPHIAIDLGMLLVIVGVLSAILAILYAFQQRDWRGLLSLSSAENASIAVTTLGAALMFRADNLSDLAALAWTVSLLHLAGHALAKGGLFLTSDSLLRSPISRRSWVLGIGALFAAMSLAAMPPQAGFVSEWFVFQTVFQGFHLSGLGGRLVLVLAGAGLALTAAIALATFIKVLGIGLLGNSQSEEGQMSRQNIAAVGLLGICVLALAVGMPAWLPMLQQATATRFASDAALRMRDGLLLVPLTAKFAFISPSKLVIAMPLLAIIPIVFLLISRRFAIRRAPVWFGGLQQNVQRTATTALTFSNALRTFYSFIYRPTTETTRKTSGRDYFVTRLDFTHDVPPVFGPRLFEPTIRIVRAISDRLRLLQSGHLNFYLGLIGILLVVILGLTLI